MRYGCIARDIGYLWLFCVYIAVQIMLLVHTTIYSYPDSLLQSIVIVLCQRYRIESNAEYDWRIGELLS